MKKRIVFMGTPNIACAMLKQMIEDGYEIVGVVSQPDKKVGRKQLVQMSEVKKLALEYGLPIFQPVKISEGYQQLHAWNPDLIVTCAYGQFISQEILEMPPFGSINIHASLLPKLRGGAPIHWAIINGDQESGISIMRMVKKMDGGAVMAQAKVSIDPDDTMGSLYDKLKACGATLLSHSLPLIFDGTAKFIEQDEDLATVGFNIQKEEEKIDFTRDINTIYNHIRGLIPFPIGYGVHQGKKIKIHKAHIVYAQHDHKQGQLMGLLDDGYGIAVNGGYIIVEQLQLEGKAKVDAKAFYNGNGKAWMGSILE